MCRSMDPMILHADSEDSDPDCGESDHRANAT